jgi:hypothetical protein
LVPALAVPLALSTLVLNGTAWAKGGSKAVVCKTVMATVTNWALEGCTQLFITSTQSQSIDTPFPTASGSYTATITWSTLDQPHRGGPAGTTTIAVNVSAPRKNKCAFGSTEWQLAGFIAGGTTTPAIKGKVKIVACVSSTGMVTNALANGHGKPAKL